MGGRNVLRTSVHLFRMSPLVRGWELSKAGFDSIKNACLRRERRFHRKCSGWQKLRAHDRAFILREPVGAGLAIIEGRFRSH